MGFHLTSYALPLFKVKATVLNYVIFRIFNLICQGITKDGTLRQVVTEASGIKYEEHYVVSNATKFIMKK